MDGTGVIEGLRDGLQLPPDYTVSEWADMHVFLPEGAAEPGRWRTERAPYQREMMDVLTDPDVHTVVMKTSAQVGKTQIELNGIGYFIHHQPSPMLRLDPTLDMSKAFVKDKLDPMIRSTPVLSEIIADEHSRSSDNNSAYKGYPGGSLSLTGANSPTSLRMRSVKILWADEVDAYPITIGSEGDPLKLAYKRTQTFRSQGAKMVMASTPLLKGLSRITTAYENSDQRRYHVPCPQCGTFQDLKWENVAWDKGKPESAYYVCLSGCIMTDSQIKQAVMRGVWKAEKEFNGVAGFHIWQIYSPWSSLEEIVKDYEEAQDRPNLLQIFWNTVLGEEWDGDETAKTTAEELLGRREPYSVENLPDSIAVLVAGVDVQGNRLEVLVKGYGVEREEWCVDYHVINGDPTTDPPWKALEEYLLRRFMVGGVKLAIEAAAIDSGFHTQRVYDFAAKHFRVGRQWYAIKGAAGAGVLPWQRSRISLKGGARVFLVGVDALKESVYARLGTDAPGAGYLHFPNDAKFGKAFFEGLIAERVRTIYDSRGYPRREWMCPPGERNEPLDLNVYADAAHTSLNIDHAARLAARKRKPNPSEDVAAVAALFAG